MRERLLALVEPYPGSQRLVRRAWRSAQRLGADVDLLWIRPPGRELADDQQRSLTALRQLASMLGARLLVEESDTRARGDRRGGPPPGQHLRADGRAAAPGAAWPACARRCPNG